MVGLKKNIWTLYMMLLTVSIVTFSLFGYYHYQATLDKYKDKQLLQLELFASSVESLLKGQESLLEVVGHQLVEQNSFTRTAAIQTRPMLDKLLNIHPAIIGFGLTNPNGDYISVSSNLILEKLHNLKQDPLTRETFLEALNSDRMVIGRTYFMEAQDSLVIPIRKAIPDKNGVVQAVMTAGFNMNTSSVFRNDIHANEHNRVSLIRNDGYLTFSSSEDTTIKDYQEPADDLNKQALLDQIQQDYGWDTDQVKQLTRAINVVVDTQRLNELITLKYLPDYGLWAASSTDLGFIKRGFYSQFAFYCIVFLIVQAAFYALFRSIANNEHETKERLLYQACHDHLTRLPNREYLRSNIQRWMCGSSNPFTLMFIDIDNFKSVNDTHGHEFGDEVLKQISTRLNHFSGEGRLIVREASDEFIFIVNRTDEETIKDLASELIQTLSKPYNVNDNQFLLSCSIGMAFYPMHGDNLDALLLSADIAMYQAKKQRNAYSLFNQEMQASHLHKMKVEQRLRLAIEKQTLFMAYQPQLNINGNIYGVEALVRWEDEELGKVPPNEFVPVAESSGLMVRLGELIIEKSLEDMDLLTTHLATPIQMSINISVKQFLHAKFIERLMAAMDKYHLDCNRITLEITENLFIEDLEKFSPTCERLHALGFKISLDDFGTGYSSLSMLRTLPIDEVKIDKSFVDNIEHDKKALNMVKNIIAIGKNFEMKVLAEGVETQRQRDQLEACGCDLIQGYFYSKPLSFDQLVSFVKDNKEEKAIID
ncbi:bifunctional diguanylate cyclase/phosphodiesterase [Vibrio parahaemolyticus]|uniref:bifunctional diguanylate cyclase/phosphodiesterase n=1 Tax=Vibrio parahaemolyticus TaxID=670 RepID=UPI00041E4B06|nr:EAL domain-containing protein [Vibrio parahaemolyticus]EGU6975733.1 EAL domain-containing protein [Vibrio parahaemolyticus]EIO2936131.1 EAL domain-containing protein [Vibrio parahaemolyticus]EJG0885671.1 EAL domain-containing protein [Vibrio parahaemolyticus]EKB1989318.1 EAL domain-containing protein [Vibrio parahaemolyticus]EME0133029.1 EAL domain-containing protein [Vibrio parahaemolyticus]